MTEGLPSKVTHVSKNQVIMEAKGAQNLTLMPSSNADVVQDDASTDLRMVSFPPLRPLPEQIADYPAYKYEVSKGQKTVLYVVDQGVYDGHEVSQGESTPRASTASNGR